MNSAQRLMPERIIAIDACPYAIRAALIDSRDNALLDGCEAKPDQAERVARFVQRYQELQPFVIGSRLDHWPPELDRSLHCKNISVYRLNSNPLQSVIWHMAPWQKKQRLQRARLLAYLAGVGTSGATEIARLALTWQRLIHAESLDEATRALASLDSY